MSRYDFDLFTLGAGSGGVRATRLAAQFGARAAVAEVGDLGGTCVNVGCIPKKLFVYASHFSEDFVDAGAYGWTVGKRTFDWNTLIANKNREIKRLNDVYRNVLDSNGVQIMEGRAEILDPHTVRVGERRFTAEYLLVATGGWPERPTFPGSEHTITSNEAFHLKKLPERLIIVGGSYIAVEFSGIFHGMGTKVTQLYRGPLFLRGFDNDVRETLAKEMLKKGVDLQFDTNVVKIEKDTQGLRVSLTNGEVQEVDEVLFAIGRAPSTANIGLGEAGVDLDEAGAVVVDEFSRSSVPSIYAIGDVTNRINLTPVAIREGIAIANTLFDQNPTRPDHTDVPTCVFSQPSLGTVGLTEEEARERYPEIDVYLSKFRPLKHSLTGREEQTLMKLVVDRESDRVVGCHMVGPDAGEIIQGLAIAVKCRATKAQFDATVGIHPTGAEEFVTMREPA